MVASNKKLRNFYGKVYKKGERRHYTKLLLKSDKIAVDRAAVLKELSWKDKDVLEVGCGTGELAWLIAKRGARKVLAIDYSPSAIKITRERSPHPRLIYECLDVDKAKGKFDVIVSLGTLEHMDNPLATLKKLKKLLRPGGSLILTCPNWTNPRGYILMTLWHLFGAKITLADRFYLTPIEFEKWARTLGMKLRWSTIAHDWAHGRVLLKDFERRLPNVLRDMKVSTSDKQIKKFINWIETH